METDNEYKIDLKGLSIGDYYHAEIPILQSRLIMRSQRRNGSWENDMVFTLTGPVPNWWRRFWYWALLGWKWERIESDATR